MKKPVPKQTPFQRFEQLAKKLVTTPKVKDKDKKTRESPQS